MSQGQEQKRSKKTKKDIKDKQPEQKNIFTLVGTRKKPESLKEDKKKEVLQLYIRDKYINIALDLYLLFVLGLTYCLYLIIEKPEIGWWFLIFTLICCWIIGFTYYYEIKREVDIVLKDLEIIFR